MTKVSLILVLLLVGCAQGALAYSAAPVPFAAVVFAPVANELSSELTSSELRVEASACPDGAEPWDDTAAWELATSLVGVDSSNPPVVVKRDADWPFADYEAGMWVAAPCTFEGHVTHAVWLHMPYADGGQPVRAHEAMHEALFRFNGDGDTNHLSDMWDELDALTLTE